MRQAILNIIVILVVTATSAGIGIAQNSEKIEQAGISAKQLVVMIDGRFPTTGALTSGAGIVVGRKGGLVYIVTAGHVVRNLSEDAQDLVVQFPDKPGFEVEPYLLSTNFSKGLDLALLGVPENKAPNNIVELDTYPAANLTEQPQEGEGVYFVGQPAGVDWGGNKQPEPISLSATTEIEVASQTVEPGLSGGAALDEKFRIIGIIVESEGATARLIPIKIVREAMLKSEKPFFLADSSGRAAVPAISARQARDILSELGFAWTEDGFDEAIKKQDLKAVELFDISGFRIKHYYLVFHLSLPNADSEISQILSKHDAENRSKLLCNLWAYDEAYYHFSKNSDLNRFIENLAEPFHQKIFRSACKNNGLLIKTMRERYKHKSDRNKIDLIMEYADTRI